MDSIFSNIFIWAQVAGAIAMCFSLAAWQMKKQEHIMLCYAPGGFFWGVQYLLLGTYNGAMFSFVSMIKDLVLSRASASALKYVVGAFILFNVVLLFVFYKSLIDALPLMVCLFCNIPMLFQDNRYWIARCNIGAQLCWIVFNLSAGAYMGVICAVLIISSNLMGMARIEGWSIGKCYRTFLPSIARSLFAFPNFRTFP